MNLKIIDIKTIVALFLKEFDQQNYNLNINIENNSFFKKEENNISNKIDKKTILITIRIIFIIF